MKVFFFILFYKILFCDDGANNVLYSIAITINPILEMATIPEALRF
jgi:hypothetical protein